MNTSTNFLKKEISPTLHFLMLHLQSIMRIGTTARQKWLHE